MIQFDIITIFPELIEHYANESILKRAQEKKLIQIKAHDLRDFTIGKHKQVDDRPFGGGPGMILMVEPIAKAINKIKSKPSTRSGYKSRVIMLTPAGKTFDQKMGKRLAKYDQLILLSGRYEGFDARIDKLVDEKISIGNYVLAGGELPAMIVTEVVARHIPSVVGHKDALAEETFGPSPDYVEYPQYTRPENYKGQKVPEILLSGNHKKISEWRQKMAKIRKI
ncbi:MAG: tRNA (guanosine(37)-N1)-methyltransferase TrmD [Candidatus Buchananbacteria bacterium]|nr:tRNA (guanosine(37)-N1)-methyltransferase TrmD [Candidatus Buchananbacteria bacterium]